MSPEKISPATIAVHKIIANAIGPGGIHCLRSGISRYSFNMFLVRASSSFRYFQSRIAWHVSGNSMRAERSRTMSQNTNAETMMWGMTKPGM